MTAGGARLGAVLPAVILASAASIASTDLYVPGLPDLAGYFDTTPRAVQLTVSLNMLAFALAQLWLGPLSDRFGRRPVFLWGLAAFTVMSLACAAAQTIGQLVAGRVLQGLAAAVEAVVGLAVIRDLFDGVDRVRALAIWGLVIAVAPALAPIVGGYVHVLLGWQANFVLVALAGLLAWWMVRRSLPESAIPDRAALHPVTVLRGYAALLGHTGFMGHALLMGVSLGAIFAFMTDGPFLLIERYGVAVEHYGFYQGTIVVGFIAGSALTNRLAHRVSLERLLAAGLAVAAVSAVLVALAVTGPLAGRVVFTATMTAFVFGLGPIFAIAPSRALDHVPARIGTAAALLGVVETGVAALGALAVTAMHDGSGRPLATVMVAVAVLAVAAALLARRGAAG